VRVVGQPDVVLREEELQAEAADGGEEVGVVRPEERVAVAEPEESRHLLICSIINCLIKLTIIIKSSIYY
jgi:hypothetical protein